MFAPRFLIYKNPSKRPLGGSSARKKAEILFEGDGKTEYAAINKKIGALTVDTLKFKDIKGIIIEITELKTKLLYGKKGLNNCFMKGKCISLLFKHLASQIGLDDLQVYGKNGFFANRKFDWRTFPQFFKMKANQRKILEQLLWLADPVKAFDQFMEAYPGDWKTPHFNVIVGRLHFFVREYYGYFITAAKRKELYAKVLDKYESHNKGAKSPERLAFLKHMENSGDYWVDVPNVEDVYKNVLDQKSIKIFHGHTDALVREAKKITTDKQLEDFLSNTAYVGTWQTNSVIDNILTTSGKPISGVGITAYGHENYPIRQGLFIRFINTVSNIASGNPNISLKLKRNLIIRATRLRRKFGFEPRLDGNKRWDPKALSDQPAKALTFTFEEGDVIVAKSVKGSLKNAPKIPKIPGMGSAALDASVKSVHGDVNALVMALRNDRPVDQKDVDVLVTNIAELKALFMKKFGTDVLYFAHSELVKYKAQMARVIDYYEMFANAIVNAKKIEDYQVELENLRKVKPSKIPSYDQEEFYRKYLDLREMYRDISLMTLLPSKKSFTLQNSLKHSAKQLYTEWSAYFKIPPKLAIKRTLDRGEGSLLDDDATEFRYSPFVDRVDDESLDDIRSFEIPEVMDRQLNRLNLVVEFASVIFSKHQKNVKGFSVNPSSFFSEANSIKKQLHDYYLGNEKGSREYDGKTPFELTKEMNSHSHFSEFMNQSRQMFEVGKPANLTISKHIKLYVPMANYLNEQGVDAEELMAAIWINEVPYQDQLVQLFGGADLSRGDIKMAGCSIAIMARKHLDNYILARGIMAKLLYPHMAKSRRNARKGISKAKLRKQARDKAIDHMRKSITPAYREMVRKKLGANFTEQYKANNKGKLPPKDKLDYYVGLMYKGWYRDFQELQTVIFENLILNFNALSDKNFEWNGVPDEADKKILKQFRDSIGAGGSLDWTDETWDCMERIGSFMKEFVVEIGILALSIVTGAGALRLATTVGKWGLSAARILKWARRIATVHPKLFAVARFAATNVVQGAIFAQAYPTFHNALTKGPKMKTLFDTLKKKGWGPAALQILGESAMFASFHGVSYLTKFLKLGRAGRALHRLGANPNHSRQVNHIFSLFKGVKNPKEADRLLRQLINPKRGIKIGSGKYEKVSGPIRKALGTARDNFIQLQERYFRFLGNVQDSTAKKILGRLIQDGAFDMAAMMLGMYAKHGIYKGDTEKVNMWTAETLFRMYTMGLAFRTTFGYVGKLKEAMRKRKTNSPQGLLEIVKTLIIEKTTLKDTMVNEHNAKVETATNRLTAAEKELNGILSRCKRSSRKYSKTAGRDKVAQGFVKKGGKWELRKDVESLQREILLRRKNMASLKNSAPKTKTLDAEISTHKAELREYELAIKDMPLGDFAVPSWIAKILPRGVREHLYKTYRHNGEFLGSDGFINLCKTDINAAMKILRNTKRSILSPGQVIYVASKLSPGNAKAFLTRTGEIMTTRQHVAYSKMIQWMNPYRVKAEQLPEDLRALYKKAKSSRRKVGIVKRWQSRLITWAGIGGITLLAGAGCSSKPTLSKGPTVTLNSAATYSKRPASAKPGDKGGELYMPPSKYSNLKESSSDSPVFAFSTRIKVGGEALGPFGKKRSGHQFNRNTLVGTSTPKEWPGAIPSNLFTRTYAGQERNQKEIIDFYQKSGVSEKERFAIANTFGIMPAKLKPFTIVIASLELDASGKVKKATPYILFDHAGYKTKYSKDVINTLKEADIVDSELYQTLARKSHKLPWNIFLYLFLFRAAVPISRRLRGVKAKPLEPIAGARGVITLGSVLVRAARWAGRRLNPIREVVDMRKEELYTSNEFPTLDQIITGLEPLQPGHSQALLYRSYLELKDGNFRKLKFRKSASETAEVMNKRVASMMIKARYYELRMNELGSEIKQLDDAGHGHHPRRQWASSEYNRLQGEVSAINEGLSGVFFGTKNPFDPKFLRTPEGTKTAADAIAFHHLVERPGVYEARDIATLRTNAEKQFNRLKSFFETHEGIKGVKNELTDSAQRLNRLRDEYNQRHNDTSGESEAFCRMYEAMQERHAVNTKKMAGFKKALSKFWKSAYSKMRTSEALTVGSSAIAAALAYAIWRFIGYGSHEDLEKGNLDSAPQLDDFATTTKGIRDAAEKKAGQKAISAPLGFKLKNLKTEEAKVQKADKVTDTFRNFGIEKSAVKPKPMSAKQKATIVKQEGQKIKAVDGLFRKSMGIQ